MTIIEALIEENCRVSNGSRWLTVEKLSDGTLEYTVWERRYKAKNTNTVVLTDDEAEAVLFLNGGICKGC